MAHNDEPMDIDHLESDFDNKENSIYHSNVYPRTPCTEKGYEELDVSELNMKLRYSVTPVASPMSKSYTANCADNRNFESGEDVLNGNLTRSLNSAIIKSDVTNKSVKTMPLQSISTELFVDNNRNSSVLRPLDATVDDNVQQNIFITVTQSKDVDENLSFQSSSSSTAQTPGATTPTKDIPRGDGGSPIMRGLKSVLNMFRSSQSPIPPADNADSTGKQILSPVDTSTSTPESSKVAQAVLASTPLAHKHNNANLSKRSSPNKESLVFNEDLEKELLWKDETTILFSEEKIPIHKLFLQQPLNLKQKVNTLDNQDNLNTTVEYMDISGDDSIAINKTVTDLQNDGLNESDGEFVDCETTFTNKSEVDAVTGNEIVYNENERNSSIIKDKNDIGASDNTEILHESELLKKEENSHIETITFKQIEDQVLLNDVTSEMSAEINSNKLVNFENTNVPINNDVESIVSNKCQEETNFTFELEKKEPQIDKSVEENITQSSTNAGITQVISESDPSANLQNNVSNSVFSQIECLPVDSCNVTYTPKNENTTFVKETIITDFSEVNNITVSDVVSHNATFAKEVENSLLPLTNTNLLLVTKNKGETFVNEIENFPLPLHDSTKIITKTEDATFVKEAETLPCPPEDNATIVVTKRDNDAFVKEVDKTLDSNTIVMTSSDDVKEVNVAISSEFSDNGIPINNKVKSVTLPCSDSDPVLKDLTFLKENSASVDNNIVVPTGTVGYDTFVKEIEKESAFEEINTSTPSTDLDFRNPANIPLPDEEDIENEKSLGTSMLIEEKTISVELGINNATVTKTENKNIVEEMPEMIAKSMDIKNAINEFIAEKDLPVIGDNCIFETNKMYSHRNSITNTVNQQELSSANSERHEIMPQDVSMEINESVTWSHQDVAQQNTFTQEDLDQNLDISMAEITNESDATSKVQPISNYQENVVSSEIIHGQVELLQSDVNNTIAPDITEMLVPNDIQDFTDTDTAVKKSSDIIEDNKLDITKLKSSECEIAGVDIKMRVSEENTVNAINVSDENNKKILPNKFNVDETALQIVSQLKDTDVKEPDCSDTTKIMTDLTKEINSGNETTGKKETDALISYKINEKKDEPINKAVEEIILSENDNPHVSGGVEFDNIPSEPVNIDEIENPFATKSRVVLTPPSSPKIVSKGYNFNFDEIDDPFATKTKIRMSPTPDTSPRDMNRTSEEKFEPPKKDLYKDKRKSQSERKRPAMPKKKLNSTFSGSLKTKNISGATNRVNNTTITNTDCPKDQPDMEPKSDVTYIHEDEQSQSQNKVPRDLELPETSNTLNITTNIDPVPENVPEVSTDNTSEDIPKEQKSIDDHDVDTATEVNEENKSSVESISGVSNENKKTSSSEQSAYYSAGTSSGESKNVFNIPEIDDASFNPFITKSKMRQSPPPGLPENAEKDSNYTETNVAFEGAESKIADIIVDEREADNITNVTGSSKSSKNTDDKDVTVREVHTEDEDTQEGPFFEADNDAMSDLDGEDVDMLQFSELPPQNNYENLDSGEMFIDAEAFEFLLNQNKSNIVSNSGKESLFLKFDPLFAKRVSTDGMLSALNKVQKRQSTPKKTAPPMQLDATFDKVVAGPSNLDVTHDIGSNITTEGNSEDLNVTVSKPMMVVTPAVNPVVTPRNKITTPTGSNRRSITFTSPAIAVIDRLLSLSGNNSPISHDTSVNHLSREQNEAALALTQLRELLAEKETNVYNLRSESKELKERLSSLESQMRILESESEERLRKVNELNERLTEKTKINKRMAAVVEEYERTIASLIAETEQDKKRHNEERIRLIKERDEQTAHLTSMEVSFSDLHSKYEKSKQIILTCKSNENSYKKSMKEFEENFSKMLSNYELLKQHASSKLNHANQELEKMNRAHESEILKMNAILKRKELHITSLEETLAQKTKANEELTAICDELINKVG